MTPGLQLRGQTSRQGWFGADIDLADDLDDHFGRGRAPTAGWEFNGFWRSVRAVEQIHHDARASWPRRWGPRCDEKARSPSPRRRRDGTRSSLWSSGPGKRSDGLTDRGPSRVGASGGRAGVVRHTIGPRLAAARSDRAVRSSRPVAADGTVAPSARSRRVAAGAGSTVTQAPASTESPSRSDLGTRRGRESDHDTCA